MLNFDAPSLQLLREDRRISTPKPSIPVPLRHWRHNAVVSKNSTSKTNAVGSTVTLRASTKAKRKADKLIRSHLFWI